jgi:hypothetical protein
MRWIIRLGVLAALVIVGRELQLRQTEVAAIAGRFDGQLLEIEQTEADLDALAREIDAAAGRLGGLDEEITAIERRHPRGIPRSKHGEYARLVAERNSVANEHNALISRHRSLADDYRQTVDRHNTGVEEANALARRSTPWSVAQDLWDGLVDSWASD